MTTENRQDLSAVGLVTWGLPLERAKRPGAGGRGRDGEKARESGMEREGGRESEVVRRLREAARETKMVREGSGGGVVSHRLHRGVMSLIVARMGRSVEEGTKGWPGDGGGTEQWSTMRVRRGGVMRPRLLPLLPRQIR